MTTDPLAWVEPFAEAGADGVIFCFDSVTDPVGRSSGQGRCGSWWVSRSW